jgi:hypothetical protein
VVNEPPRHSASPSSSTPSPAASFRDRLLPIYMSSLVHPPTLVPSASSYSSFYATTSSLDIPCMKFPRFASLACYVTYLAACFSEATLA